MRFHSVVTHGRGNIGNCFLFICDPDNLGSLIFFIFAVTGYWVLALGTSPGTWYWVLALALDTSLGTGYWALALATPALAPGTDDSSAAAASTSAAAETFRFGHTARSYD